MKIDDINEQNIELYQKYTNELRIAQMKVDNYINQLIDGVNGGFNKIEINTIREIEKLKGRYSIISDITLFARIFSAFMLFIFIAAFSITCFTGQIKTFTPLIIEVIISAILISICVILSCIQNKYKNKLKGLL